MCILICKVGIVVCFIVFFFQAEDGIRDLVRSRGLGDVYKRQHERRMARRTAIGASSRTVGARAAASCNGTCCTLAKSCLLYTSDAADERSSVDLGGRRIIKKKKHEEQIGSLRLIIETH